MLLDVLATSQQRAGRVALVLVLVVLPVLAGCSDRDRASADDDSFVAADGALLVDAAAATVDQPFRHRSTLSLEGADDGALGTVIDVVDAVGVGRLLEVRGTIVGDDRSIWVKTSVLAGALDGLELDIPLDPIGVQSEARRIDGTWYVRAPRTLLVAALQEAGGRAPVDSDVLDQLASGWVRITGGDADADDGSAPDLGRVAVLDSAPLERLLDPLDLLAAVADPTEVTSAPGTFDDEDVTIVRATVALAGPSGIDGATTTTTAVQQGLAGLPMRVEAVIDGDGLLRSLSYGVTARDLAGLLVPSMADGSERADGGAFGELRIVVRTTFLDVGDDGLTVAVPEVVTDVDVG